MVFCIPSLSVKTNEQIYYSISFYWITYFEDLSESTIMVCAVVFTSIRMWAVTTFFIVHLAASDIWGFSSASRSHSYDICVTLLAVRSTHVRIVSFSQAFSAFSRRTRWSSSVATVNWPLMTCKQLNSGWRAGRKWNIRFRLPFYNSAKDFLYFSFSF